MRSPAVRRFGTTCAALGTAALCACAGPPPAAEPTPPSVRPAAVCGPSVRPSVLHAADQVRLAQLEREIAMLRAIGYPRRSILAALLTEALLLALVAGVVGTLATLVLNGRSQDMMSAGFTTVAFKLHVSLGTIAVSVCAAVMIGLLGACRRRKA